jgi:CPA2 family monovalent cation:H+ antiporter-2
MPHATPLIATLVGSLVLAFVFGALANRLRMSPIAGYLVAGVLAGPFTPGFVADAHLAQELAEIGVILLMFGVGLHFSLRDLLAVKNIAIPGAVGQMGAATLLGMLLGWALGWPWGQGLMFGLSLSCASTVVLLRAMQEQRLMETRRGHIAVGWLIVEDLASVLALVLLPALAGLLGGHGANAAAGGGELAVAVLVTVGKVVAFMAVMLVFGKRVIPWLLRVVARGGSRELLRLAVLAVALGVAFGAARLFDVSFALGAFFAGLMMGESPLARDAAEETLPLRDAFAVLFFVSIGMLLNPAVLVEAPRAVLAALGIVVIGKSLAALAIVRAFGYPLRTALTIAVSLAQIGEFTFILAGLGVEEGLLTPRVRDVILAAAIASILLNPLLFMLLDRIEPWLQRRESRQDEGANDTAAQTPQTTAQSGHVVLVGFGRVGRRVGEALHAEGQPLLVIEQQRDHLEELRALGIETILGNATREDILAAANVAHARALLVAIPDAIEAGRIVHATREHNPGIEIIARAHTDSGVLHLETQGANRVVMGERELARSMLAML